MKHLKTQMLSRKGSSKFRTPEPLAPSRVQRPGVQLEDSSAVGPSLALGSKALSNLERSGIARTDWASKERSGNPRAEVLVRVCWQCPQARSSSGNWLS